MSHTFDWLRPEENQHLLMPSADGCSSPEAMRNRLGFGMDYGAGGLGFCDSASFLVVVRRSGEVIANPFG